VGNSYLPHRWLGGAEPDSQVTKCKRTSGNGFHLQIPGKTITSLANLGMTDLEHGGFKATLTRSGNLLVQPSYGSMENVIIFHSYLSLELTISAFAAGAGKSVIWCDNFLIARIRRLMLLTSSAIVEDIRILQKSGLASLAFFYCDFREDQKKDQRGLLSSILAQLCEQSDAYSAIYSDFYTVHGDGSQHASNRELVACLKDMLKLPGQATVHIIIDALDECPKTSDLSSPREKVLELVEELVNLQLPNLRICVTSRPEADIVPILGPLAFRSVSLHAESGQVQDIADYVWSVVHTGVEMRRWKDADKQLVIDVLTEKANGM
jgi:NACHT domain